MSATALRTALHQLPPLRSIKQIPISRSIASSSRLTSISPPLRHLRLHLHRHLQPSASIRFIPLSQRAFSSTNRRWDAPSSTSPQIEAPTSGDGNGKQKIGQIEPRLQMTFTCTANDCGHRSTHEFSKRSYTNGIVLVQCPECKSRHLIADHIGWFKESLEDGKLKTVEDLLRAKGEKIKKGRINMDGDIEYEGDD
ncbi:uncharacterized protein I303_105900 [Kwoniella dejecticola CBS 10117]|uniref:DNL-type domain-containing protein n=1 Tax=Kwoniella dejecticola CBS 10117 TaxID=1296121 RepID=A0A1A6A0R5_9TREE|nr:uncharacterized protein I303_05923 [Kwoniella dejecticola CBS 10117]OBR83643.1 hypothetical protein I303_05923 [Kwoniella dejecticola CBS 10117]